MEEEVSELVLLEVGEEVAAGLDGAELGHVVRETAVNPGGCKEDKERRRQVRGAPAKTSSGRITLRI